MLIRSFRAWFVVGILSLKSVLVWMFWSFKLQFSLDILAYWQLFWLLFAKVGQFFSFLLATQTCVVIGDILVLWYFIFKKDTE
jgi:hypothetical protein